MLGFVLIRHRGITNPAICECKPILIGTVPPPVMLFADFCFLLNGLFITDMAIALPLGMIGNFAACMFSYAEGSTYLATISGTLAGLIGGTGLLFLPWTGIQSTYVLGGANQAAGVAEFYKASAMVFFISLIPIFLIFLASFRTSGPLAGAALLIVVALGCLGGAYIKGVEDLVIAKASGALFIVVGVSLFYAATSVMLAEEGWKLLPVFPLPRLE